MDRHASTDDGAPQPNTADTGPPPFGEARTVSSVPSIPGGDRLWYGDHGGVAPDGHDGYQTVADGIGGLDERSPPPGQIAVVMAALMLALLLMGTQLWLLTVALELYLGGHGRQVWLLAVVSGLIFLGGIAVLKLLGRRPHLAR
jgi:hypothetical protein